MARRNARVHERHGYVPHFNIWMIEGSLARRSNGGNQYQLAKPKKMLSVAAGHVWFRCRFVSQRSTESKMSQSSRGPLPRRTVRRIGRRTRCVETSSRQQRANNCDPRRDAEGIAGIDERFQPSQWSSTMRRAINARTHARTPMIGPAEQPNNGQGQHRPGTDDEDIDQARRKLSINLDDDFEEPSGDEPKRTSENHRAAYQAGNRASDS